MSWQDEIRNALKTPEQLEQFFGIKFPQTNFSIFVPLRIARKIQKQGLSGALAKQFIPTELEYSPLQATGQYDPIADRQHSPVPQLVHRYKNRVLFFPTQTCPIHCRYCFRQNELQEHDAVFRHNFRNVLEYIIQHPEIDEVIFSGGDPLMLTDEKLLYYVEGLAEIPHIEFIRLHTRTPVILPARINETIEKLKVNWVIHINHSSEWDEDVASAIARLRQSTVFSQSVLLRGVNDSSADLTELYKLLSKHNIIPYYLHHPDDVRGGMHFKLSQEEGLAIYEQLRKSLSGWQLPRYVIERPQGAGKTPVEKYYLQKF